MRIDECHERQEPVVRDAEYSDASIALGRVLHQPVDRVVGIGCVIDRGGIQPSVQRTIHHVVAFRPVLAADVLHDPDVATVDDDLGRVVVAVQDRTEMCALRVAGQDVWRRTACASAGWARLRAPRHQDHRVQLDAVPHRDHDVTPDVIEGIGHRPERRRSFARQGLCRR